MRQDEAACAVVFAVYNPHAGYWHVRGEVWHSTHVGLASAQRNHASHQTGQSDWRVVYVKPDGSPGLVRNGRIVPDEGQATLAEGEAAG